MIEDSQVIEAALLDDPSKLKGLLESGGNPNATDSEGKHVFFKSFESGKFENAITLIEHGAKVDNTDVLLFGYMQPLLHHASVFGLTKIVDYLLDNGADPNSTNAYRIPVLTMVGLSGIPGTGIFEHLLERGANPDCPGNDGETLLHTMLKEGRLDSVRALVKHGVDVDVTDKEGTTAFEHIISDATPEMLRLILERYPDRRDTLTRIYEARVQCLTDFMKALSSAPEDDERWMSVPDVAAAIEESNVLLAILKEEEEGK